MAFKAITVTVDDKKAVAYIDKLVKNLPERVGNLGWNITQIAASGIKEEANSAFSFPRPYLSTTIRPQKLKKMEYAVTTGLKRKQVMAIERGRMPGKSPPVKANIKRWAESAGVNPYVLARSIGEKGTKGTHFIRNGMIKGKPRIDEYVKRESRRLVK